MGNRFCSRSVPRASRLVVAAVVAIAGGASLACGDRTPLDLGFAVADAGHDASVIADASSDTSAAVDAAVDAGRDSGSACTTTGACAGPFPSFDDRCSVIDDCALVEHTVSCCGARVAMGIRATQKPAFDKAEVAWTANVCQQTCDCAAAPFCDDVGHVCGTPRAAQLECSAGRCRTICLK